MQALVINSNQSLFWKIKVKKERSLAVKFEFECNHHLVWSSAISAHHTGQAWTGMICHACIFFSSCSLYALKCANLLDMLWLVLCVTLSFILLLFVLFFPMAIFKHQSLSILFSTWFECRSSGWRAVLCGPSWCCANYQSSGRDHQYSSSFWFFSGYYTVLALFSIILTQPCFKF